MLPRRARRMEANLLHATGMLGDSLTEARSGKAHLIGQLWSRTEGKPTVRNLRGIEETSGIANPGPRLDPTRPAYMWTEDPDSSTSSAVMSSVLGTSFILEHAWPYR
jgi:hypothetical protein